MASIRCPNCNLLNFDTAPECKRCKQPLAAHEPAFAGYGTASAQTTGSVPQYSKPPVRPATTYFEPPPPNFFNELSQGQPAPAPAAYTHTITVSIPPVCVKCGGTHDLAMQKFKKDYTPPLAYFGFLLGGILPLLIVILVCRKIHKMNGLFCSECWNRYRPQSAVSTLTALGALAMMFAALIIGFASESAALGMFVFLAALGVAIWGNYYAKKVSPKYVKTNRKQIFINIPNYGEIDFTHSGALGK